MRLGNNLGNLIARRLCLRCIVPLWCSAGLELSFFDERLICICQTGFRDSTERICSLLDASYGQLTSLIYRDVRDR